MIVMKKKALVVLLVALPLFVVAYRPTKRHHVEHFYPKTPSALSYDIAGYFLKARDYFGVVADSAQVRALVVPHAGYSYSGLSAASAYQVLFEQDVDGKQVKNKKIKRVIILAPSHSVGFDGVALPEYGIYETPLGGIPVDTNAVDQLVKDRPLFKLVDRVHDKEHSLEVQLPFLQSTIADFKIVPLIIGRLADDDYERIVRKLKPFMDDTTLVVVSSDFTHHGHIYHYQKFSKDIFYHVRRLDSAVIETILDKSYTGFDDFFKRQWPTVCGKTGIMVLLKMIEDGVLNDVEGRLASYYTSPQMTAAQSRGYYRLFETVADSLMRNSVSYAGIVFTKQKVANMPLRERLTGYEQRALLQSARDVIYNEFMTGHNKLDEWLCEPVLTPQLKGKAGAFVTLKARQGNLRGCVGSIRALDPLYFTVLQNAKSAAFRDSRFAPLRIRELSSVTIDITVLEPPRPVASYHDIKLGTHGIILKKEGRAAVFLPQVPGQFGWDLPTTLTHLSEKAGLLPDAWKQGSAFEVFEGFEFAEHPMIR